MSAMDEAKAGMAHAKDQVASKFTKNKAEADDKVRCSVVSGVAARKPLCSAALHRVDEGGAQIWLGPCCLASCRSR